MKALKFIVFGIALFLAGTVQAQVQVSVNLGTPPQWGPVGYTDVQYYYLPDVEAYYDVPSARFIYLEGGNWVHRKYLPRQYRSYDLYNGYKVVMTDYRGNAPYTHFRDYKVKYAKGYRGPAQKSIGHGSGKGNYKANKSQGNYSKKGGNYGNGKSDGHGNSKGKGNGGGKGKH